jgi:hypothetical protein
MTAMNYETNRSGDQTEVKREPNERAGSQADHAKAREHHLDKTIEDSFPASDPPSTDPNPDGDD